ncbi:hypothetical protein ILYODFUR_027954 [Ilyodon furcidens]|uniref:Secreted protein n=1 Tax=Ilyodon furcidens TaxID=33524 RepID=A0ABV0TC08_9TELE
MDYMEISHLILTAWYAAVQLHTCRQSSAGAFKELQDEHSSPDGPRRVVNSSLCTLALNPSVLRPCRTSCLTLYLPKPVLLLPQVSLSCNPGPFNHKPSDS